MAEDADRRQNHSWLAGKTAKPNRKQQKSLDMRQCLRASQPVHNRAEPFDRGVPFRRRLVVMTKLPTMGRVKTRLACEVGHGRALGFYRATAAAVLARLGRDRRWQDRKSVV